MHILIIPGEGLNKNNIYRSIFEINQGKALKNYGNKVGLISINMVGSIYALLKRQIPKPVEFLKALKKVWHIVFYKNNSLEKHIIYDLIVYEMHGYYLLPGKIKAYQYYKTKTGLKAFEAYIKDNGLPDIIHAHSRFLDAALIAQAIKKKYQIPFVLTDHSSFYSRGLVKVQQIPSVRGVINDAAVWIVVSPQLGVLIEEKVTGLNKKWIFIPNVLDDIFEPLEIRNSSDHSPLFTFLNIASLEQIKGHSILLKAFSNSFKGNNKVILKIGGEGNLKDELKTMVNELGISNQVEFLGQLSRKEVVERLYSCNAFVLPSLYETFGVVLIEALACGKPVIATKCGGPETIVDKSNGFLINVNDVDALSQAMFNIISSHNKYNCVEIKNNCLLKYSSKVVGGQLMAQYLNVPGLN